MLAPLLSLMLLLAGCMDVTNHLTLENASVKPISEGQDCTYNILGLVAVGTNRVETAMSNANPPIQTIRTIKTNAWHVFPLPFAMYCLEVVGEPAPGVKRDPGYDPTAAGSQ